MANVRDNLKMIYYNFVNPPFDVPCETEIGNPFTEACEINTRARPMWTGMLSPNNGECRGSRRGELMRSYGYPNCFRKKTKSRLIGRDSSTSVRISYKHWSSL